MNNRANIRCLVVDDEPLGRERVVQLLRDIPNAELVGVCSDGSEAVESIGELTPDLIFLDVQMPELDGFGVLAAIPQRNRPEVIFITAHDQYALKAFEVHAQDYVLKPFDPDRLYAAFNRAAERIESRRSSTAPNAQLQALIDHMEQQRARRTRIPIKSDGRVTLLPVEEIDWIESDDNHVKIHAGTHTHLVRQTLQSMEQSLSPSEFVRVHRSSMVNVSRIKEIQPWFNGEYVVILRNGTQVKTSRGYRARLEQLMS
ncbi:MAG: LytTR family DNA-binding domain-containing protein [Gemmatimonadaceae bacterium]